VGDYSVVPHILIERRGDFLFTRLAPPAALPPAACLSGARPSGSSDEPVEADAQRRRRDGESDLGRDGVLPARNRESDESDLGRLWDVEFDCGREAAVEYGAGSALSLGTPSLVGSWTDPCRGVELTESPECPSLHELAESSSLLELEGAAPACTIPRAAVLLARVLLQQALTRTMAVSCTRNV
jgi:hypothetical protein